MELAIGGLTRFTTIDFPGHLAAVVFCHGCAWRCPGCHNGHLQDAATPSNLITWDKFLTFLDNRHGLLDGIVFSGGEPLLQKAKRVNVLAIS